MKKAECILASLAIISVVLKLCSVDGAILLSTVSFITLSLFYLALSFLLLNDISLKNIFYRVAYKHANGKHILWALASGFSLCVGILGVLFKLNKWPGGSMLLVMGMLFLICVVTVSLIRYVPRPAKFHAGILIRSGILFLVSMVLYVQ